MPATPGGTDYRAYYDPNLDVTWLADVNLVSSNTFGLPVQESFGDGNTMGPYPGACCGDGIISSDGRINWVGALWYVDAMNASNNGEGYLGFNDWRLPKVLPINGSSYQMTYSGDGTTDRGYASTTTDGSDGGWRDASGKPASELGFLYYVTLQNEGRCDPDGCQTVTPDWGPLGNVGEKIFWSGNELNMEEDCTNGVDDDFDGVIDAADPDCAYDDGPFYGLAWGFWSNIGAQDVYSKGRYHHLFLVRDGDTEICGNGLDDDGDGLIDGDDVDCQEVCGNGADDDGDGLIDVDDPDCQEVCGNGTDDDGDGLIDGDDPDCVEICDNGIDDDGDGLIDIDDPECELPAVGLSVRCLHRPLWPDDGEQVQIEAEVIDQSGAPVRAERVEIYTGGPQNTPAAASDALNLQTFETASGRSIKYACYATRGSETAFSGWREADVGEPEFADTRAVPVIFNGLRSEKVDILFIPEENRHLVGSGGYDLFQEDIYQVLKLGLFGVPWFVRHQDEFNIWLARDFGSVFPGNPDDGSKPCVKNKPDNFKKDYSFVEAGGIMHNQDCRDNASLRIFTTRLNPLRYQVVAHEIGHAAFSLSDEYQGAPSFYFTLPDYPNLFPFESTCRSAASDRGYNPDDCRRLDEAAGFFVGGFWIFEPDYSLLSPETPDLMQQTGSANCGPQFCAQQYDVGPSETGRMEWKLGKCKLGRC